MFGRKAKVSELDARLHQAILQLDVYPADSEEYAKIMDQIQKHYTIKKETLSYRVSPDTLAVVAANVFITAIVVGHERAGMVTSKFATFIIKAKS